MLISVAIPCYHAENNIAIVAEAITNEFSKHPEHELQLILVNDGSTDNTFGVIKKLCNADKRVVGVELSRNFSQANAKMAALEFVRGDVLVFMDDDGQHPAEGIFLLINKLLEGYDIIYAESSGPAGGPLHRIAHRLNDKMASILGTKPEGIHTGSFAAYSRFAIEQLRKYRSPMPSPLSYGYNISTRIANVSIDQNRRISGSSGYSIKRLFALALQSYTAFTLVPLRIADILGLLSISAGIIYAIALAFTVSASPQHSFTGNITHVLLLVIGGMIMLLIGIVGEYAGRIYLLLSNKPQYIVREAINARYDHSEQS